MLNNRIFTTLLITGALAGGVSPASYAADGLFVSGGIGATTLGHTLNRNTGSADVSSSTTTSDSTDASIKLGIGYKSHVSDNFYLSIEGFYSTENASTRNTNGVLITDIDLESTYGATLRLGLDVTEKYSVYAHVGATNLDFDVNNSYTFAPPKRDISASEIGVSFGLGSEYQVSSKLAVYAEYSQLNDVSFDPIPEVAFGTGRINDNELDINSFTLGLRYFF